MKEIVLLFGEMGGGKTYLGQKLAKAAGYKFVEGDMFVHLEMRQKVDNFRPIPTSDIRRLVDTLKYEIPYVMAASESGIVLTQALYNDAHRKELIEYWVSCGYSVSPFLVRPNFFRHVRQLWGRQKGLRWVLYWLLSKPFFQMPTHHCALMFNNR